MVKRTLRLPPGRYVLETAVQDRESGHVGARRSAFEIPTPAPALSLGSVAIVRADEVSPPGADVPGSSGEPAAGGITDDPLRAGHLKATPLLGRSFPEGTPAVSLLLSLYAGPAARRPEVELEFRRDGQTVAHATPELPAPDAGRARHVRRELSHGEPRPGPLRGLGARPAGRRRGHRGHRVHDHAPGLTCPSRTLDGTGGPPASAAPSETAAAGAIEDRKGVATPLATILERAGRYVRDYEQTFRNLVAEESYRQWGPNPKVVEGQEVRTLRSDLVFVRLPGPAALGHLPRRVRGGWAEGPGPRAAPREAVLRAEGVGRRAGAGDPERELAVQPRPGLPQRQRPGPGPPLPAAGEPGAARLQAEGQADDRRLPHGGGRVRGEDEPDPRPRPVDATTCRRAGASGSTRPGAPSCGPRSSTTSRRRSPSTTPDAWERGLVSTEYRREIGLECFVPDSMTELYNFRGLGRIDAVARYSKYRRFEVSVGTAEVLPLAYGPDVAGPGRTEPDPSEIPHPPEPELAPGAMPTMPRAEDGGARDGRRGGSCPVRLAVSCGRPASTSCATSRPSGTSRPKSATRRRPRSPPAIPGAGANPGTGPSRASGCGRRSSSRCCRDRCPGPCCVTCWRWMAGRGARPDGWSRSSACRRRRASARRKPSRARASA